MIWTEPEILELIQFNLIFRAIATTLEYEERREKSVKEGVDFFFNGDLPKR